MNPNYLSGEASGRKFVIKEMNQCATAAITGGAVSVGSACAKLLAPLVKKLLIVDIKKDALHNLVSILAKVPTSVEGMTPLDQTREANIVFIVTNNPHIFVTANHLKPGAIVIDAAQPKNISEEIPHMRPDVVAIESTVVRTPDVDVQFDLDLAQGAASHIIAAGRSLGFRLAPFRNSHGPITDTHLLHTAQIRIVHQTP